MCATKGMSEPNPYDRVFRNCDFNHVKNELISTLTGGVFPQEMVNLLDAFVRQPCRDTAIPLLRYNPEFAILFHDSARSKESMNQLGIDTSRPALTVGMLTQELEFEEYCNAVYEDIAKHKSLKQKLLAKGYTESQLSKAFDDYWRDLSSGI